MSVGPDEPDPALRTRQGYEWDAEDLTSAVFLHAWRRRAEIQLDRSSALSWPRGCRVGTVKSRLSRVRKRLQGLLVPTSYLMEEGTDMNDSLRPPRERDLPDQLRRRAELLAAISTPQTSTNRRVVCAYPAMAPLTGAPTRLMR